MTQKELSVLENQLRGQRNLNPGEAQVVEAFEAREFLDKIIALSSQYPKFRGTGSCTTPKDPQQRRVYAAEGLHSEWRDHRFVSFGELRNFVTEVQSSLWYKARLGDQPIEVSKGGDDELAARGGLFFISIPPIHRRKMVVLHEVAHAIYWRPTSRAQDHGPNFCRIYLELVAKFMGKESAIELQRLFRAKGVSVSRTRSMQLTDFHASRVAPWKAARIKFAFED